ncbi:MAG: methionine--tRNA ligase [Candidatus Pacearchaeota archaeon]
MKKFYITTTIPYANAPPHIGHALEFVQADVIARWNRLKGNQVFFLTGTDEHGTKNYQTAKKEGLNPQDFVNKNAKYFKEILEKLHISNDNFIRTTDKKAHWPGVIEMWKTLSKKGDIYEKEYEGFYCSGCERFVTEKDLINGKCPDHPKIEIQKISEKNYFFKLSKYSDKIKSKIESGELTIYPQRWKNDFLGLIKEGLTDVSFSRDKEHLPWGIPVPGDDSQVMYVWCDALTNYLTGIDFPDKEYKKFWPADIHVVGKDMLRFHTGIWPGMLLSAGLPLPKKVIVHGFLTSNGQKMSKSTGNTIDPFKIIEEYGSDALRYFFCRNYVFGEDGDIQESAIVRRYNDELANKYGNLISRVCAISESNGIKKSENSLIKKLKTPKIKKLIENFEFDKALNEIFTFIDLCNEYIQTKKPWETKDQKVPYELADSIKKITILLYPFIPNSTEKIAKHLDFKISLKELEKPLKNTKIKKAPVFFEKKTVPEEQPKPKANINKSEEPKEIMEGVTSIEYADFEKMNLKVAEIQNIEDIEGADKLYKLTISLGDEVRTICAGIKQFYSHDELKGKRIVVLTNLKPRTLRGIESKGMLLAATNKDHSKVSLLTPDQEIEVGSQVS